MKLKILHPEDLQDLVCVVMGTRPGIIKQSPVIRALSEDNVPFFTIHTGQHYSYEMDLKFFEDLELPKPDIRINNLGKEQLHGEQTAEMLKGVEAALIQKRPKMVLVGGDANTNLAAALASRKLHIPVGHVEAGLRSYDWRMPEEHNRVIIDHISECLFIPSQDAEKNLKQEGVRGKIFQVGSTVVDAIAQHLPLADKKSRILNHLNLDGKKFALMTVHREENTDYFENLQLLLSLVKGLIEQFRFLIVFPVHPRTRKRMEEFNLLEEVKKISNLILLDPLGYLDFLQLLKSSSLALTDSGGLQQEACILHIPCITLRESTEWVETVQAGFNIVAGMNLETATASAEKLLSKEIQWTNLYGDGTSGKQVSAIVQRLLKEGIPVPGELNLIHG
ncbi:MAG: UDP-N-acetylglucosamine 2-epimerase (non-hydrolyzing) [Firmicutes bacterium]|nr:UDP-N-acetylglucosamine 2-epimerase (non-hydrolyzing) [Bacillota bacterium]